MTETVSTLVTGSSGMIGTALTQVLLRNGEDVIGLDRNHNRWSDDVDSVTNRADLLEDDLRPYFEEAETVVHLAAHSRVAPTIDEPNLAVENIETTAKVIEQARRVDAKLIYPSSREVYGDLSYAPSEDAAGIRNPSNPYGASKASGEALIAAAENCHGLDACVLRISNVYGPYDASDRVIPLFISQAIHGQELTIYGSETVLDFVHLDNCVDGILAAMERFEKARGEAFNIVSGVGTSVLELANIISTLVDREVTVRVEPDRRGEVSRFIGDPTKARRLLGIDSHRSLREGLTTTVEWYREHEDITRSLAGLDG